MTRTEYLNQLDAIASRWVSGLKNYAREARARGLRPEPITTNTSQTESAIRNFLRHMGFENAGSMRKATMLYIIYRGIDGGYESIGVDPDSPSLDEARSALMDMAGNIGVSSKQLQDWMNTVV